MPTVHLLPADLARVRFAPSPLWEAVGSLWRPAKVLGTPAWLDAQTARDEAPTLRALLLARQYTPDFLTPPPAPTGEFDDNLSILARTPHDEVRAHLEAYGRVLGGRVEDVVEQGLRDPQRLLDDVTRELEAYWQRTLEPAWPRIRSILEGDVLLRGRSLAVDGPEVAFAHLHVLLKFDGRALHVKEQGGEPLRSFGNGLVFMPTVFHASPCYMLNEQQPCVISYEARGAASLWTAGEAPQGSLEELLGGTRARMLSALRAPVSNRVLAAHLGVTPAAVSQHLAVLRRADLVRQHRVGRAVYFLLTARGEALLDLFAAPPSHLPFPSDANGLTA